MIQWTYLAALLGALGCMLLLDHRLRLVLWKDLRRGAFVLAAGTVGFLVWDVIAVEQEFYRRGQSDLMTGIELAPELPLEELFFIVFLCYLTLVLHQLIDQHVLADRTPVHRSSE